MPKEKEKQKRGEQAAARHKGTRSKYTLNSVSRIRSLSESESLFRVIVESESRPHRLKVEQKASHTNLVAFGDRSHQLSPQILVGIVLRQVNLVETCMGARQVVLGMSFDEGDYIKWTERNFNANSHRSRINQSLHFVSPWTPCKAPNPSRGTLEDPVTNLSKAENNL